jgi:hypothetical protein
MGLLTAGVSVTAGIMCVLPRWLVVFGLVLAVAAELSWLHMAFPQLLFLIPLVRFPGFVWLIAVGFLLPKTSPYLHRQMLHPTSLWDSQADSRVNCQPERVPLTPNHEGQMIAAQLCGLL